MNRLQLVQRVHQESGLSTTAPVATLNQSGMSAKLVNFVDEAWEEIQNSETTWRFANASTGGSLISGTDTYNPVSAWGIAAEPARWIQDWRAAYVYRTADGLGSRQFLTYLPWEQFRGMNIPVVSGTPIYWTVQPDGDVQYFPRPNVAGLASVHEFYAANQMLAADGDIPRCPVKFHLAIAWCAVKLYCGHDNAAELYGHAAKQADQYMDRMRASELPQMGSPGALA